MIRSLLNICVTVVFSAALLMPVACTSADASQTQTADTTSTMPQASPAMLHTVFFWLKDGLSQEEKEQFIKDVRTLATVPGVQQFELGGPAATVDRDVTDNSFDYALMLGFENEDTHQMYQEHPIHLAFVDAQGNNFKEVRVFDHLTNLSN